MKHRSILPSGNYCIFGVGSFPKGQKYHCAVCGAAGRHFVIIGGADDVLYMVSYGCLGPSYLVKLVAPSNSPDGGFFEPRYDDGHYIAYNAYTRQFELTPFVEAFGWPKDKGQE